MEGYIIIGQPAGPVSLLCIDWPSISGVLQPMHIIETNMYSMNIAKWGWPVFFGKKSAASSKNPDGLKRKSSTNWIFRGEKSTQISSLGKNIIKESQKIITRLYHYR